MGKRAERYTRLNTSSKNADLKELSEIDRKGIHVGIALGHSAAHRIPSLENNSWIHWRNRFRTKVIEFDKNGKKIIRQTR